MRTTMAALRAGPAWAAASAAPPAAPDARSCRGGGPGHAARPRRTPGRPGSPVPETTRPPGGRPARSRRRCRGRTDPTASASPAPSSRRGRGPHAGNESRPRGTTRFAARSDARTAPGKVTPAHARPARRALASSPVALAPWASLVGGAGVVGPRAVAGAPVPPGPRRLRELLRGLLAAPHGPAWTTGPAGARPPHAGSSAGARGRRPAGPEARPPWPLVRQPPRGPG